MAYLDYLLWGYFIGYPIYIFLTIDKEKQMVINDPSKRIDVYRSTMLFLWVPTLILLTMVFSSELSMADIGLRWQWNMANQIAVVAVILLGAYFVISLKQLNNDSEAKKTTLEQLDYIQWIMPGNAKELRYFTYGVSVAAGVCEELLFRGYLLYVLGTQMPIWLAVVLSSLAFGAGHIYQGPVHVLRTAILGAVMAGVYLVTDSIIIPIVLHTLIDVYSGALGYCCIKEVRSTAVTA
ncbi:MAG: CPBP family intramembrane metalloprotease [Algicola sp.]|nr:CPBP family intramembrane metalloprotease [Algicola sp.]